MYPFFVSPLVPAANGAIAEQPCYQYSWGEEDDVAHEMVLPYSLPLGDTTYNTIYVTTNGTLTFGVPDATFHTYPNTPSISLAGWDWVTWGGGSLSYGVTNTGFCVEWKVRPYPQSSGDFTTIKLTVDTSRLPTWSGVVETTGWLPADLRRGIRFQANEPVVTISEAFTINGGIPVEMQTCWDGSLISLDSTCPPEPPPGECWDGSTVAYGESCPPIPPDTQCWDGSWVTWSQTCPQQPALIECWDGTSVNYESQCPPTPYLNPPRNVEVVLLNSGNIKITWDAPEESNILVEIYAISWSTTNFTSNGWGVSSNSTNYVLSPELFSSTGGLDQTYQFSVRADNNTYSTYSSTSNFVELFIPNSNSSVSPTPEPTPTETVEPTPTPTEPNPSQSPTESPTPEPSENLVPAPLPSPEAPVEPSPTTSPKNPEPSSTPTSIKNPIIESTPEPTTQPTPEIAVEEPTNTEELVAKYAGESIPLSELLALGLTYSDLPEDQEITLENGVVITAGVMAILNLLNSPSELLSEVFSNPAVVIDILSNVGADMSPEKREEAQTVVIAAVIVTQIAAISGIAAVGIAKSNQSQGAGIPAGSETVRKPKKRVIKKTPKYRKFRR